MRVLIAALIASSAAAFVTPAFASDATDAMAAINTFNDNMNKGDAKAAAATCASPAFVLDEFAPYAWRGKDACMDWANALGAFNKKNGITGTWVTASKPLHLTVEGDSAYAVVPVKLTYKEKGKPMAEDGSRLTVALHKGAAGWKIAGWAWSQH